jgi:hypothetical protein
MQVWAESLEDLISTEKNGHGSIPVVIPAMAESIKKTGQASPDKK